MLIRQPKLPDKALGASAFYSGKRKAMVIDDRNKNHIGTIIEWNFH
jgi:hypothetical protein